MTRRPHVVAAAGALAAMALVSACAGSECEIDGDAPVFVNRLGCPADHDAMGADEVDSVYSRTTSINIVVDREDDVAEGGRVYFVDPDRYPLHYDFSIAHLDDPDKTAVGTLAEFNLLNYRRPERRFILAKLVHYQDQGLTTLELSAGDSADADLIVAGFERVASVIDDRDALLYRPVSSEQESMLPELSARIPTVATDVVFSGQLYQALNPGVGYGVLRFRHTDTLGSEPVSPTDLIVLDRVPNDVSMVAGIITAEFQTPLAHVGVLAKTRGTPNMALRDAWDEPRLRALEGELVRLEVGPQEFAIDVADPADAQAYWDALRPATTQVPVHNSTTTAIFDVTQLRADDSIRVGAKAAHLGELYSIFIAGGAPLPLPAQPLAIPFAHYVNHLTTSGVQPLIDALLADVAAAALSPTELEARLFEIRWMIYRAPVDPTLLGQIAGIIGERWTADTKLRFRSSTNVEDLAEFTGAGLYTSAGARLANGTDAIGNAIKTVWASTWNRQAFVERDFYRVAQPEVRMAVLVHPASDDELANGVALTLNEFSALRPAFYINSQIGEVSVTNPTGNAVPEQVLYYPWYETPEYEVITRSSLLAWTIAWPTVNAVLTDDEMIQLGTLLGAISGRFRGLYGSDYAVDVEWKLGAGRALLIKQARPFRTRVVEPGP